MTDYEKVILIESGLTSVNLKSLLSDFQLERAELLVKYNRYRAEDLPIKNRAVEYNKINNKINNDFFSEIVDTKVGYMVGKPITYSINSDDQALKDKLNTFVTYANLADIDADTLEMMAICGKAYRLLYINTDGELTVRLENPWEVMYIKDIDEQPKYAIKLVELSLDKQRLYFYDSVNVKIYETYEGEYTLIEDKPHMLQGVPIIEFLNNREALGDCDKVIELIDAYDRTFSDVNSEVEQFRLAYLAFLGAEFDAEDVEKMKQTGAIALPQGTDAKFITKELVDAIIEHHLDRGERNILRFAKSVNFSDHIFATSSGIALKYKMQLLENKALKTERKFSKALRDMFKLIAAVWSITTPINYLDIWWQFKRNVPINILDEAETTNKLKGYVSEDTRLSLLSFVDDVTFEKEQMEKDMENVIVPPL